MITPQHVFCFAEITTGISTPNRLPARALPSSTLLVDQGYNSGPDFRTVFVPVLAILFPAGSVVPPLSVSCIGKPGDSLYYS
jgi:hypothetical protein